MNGNKFYLSTKTSIKIKIGIKIHKNFLGENFSWGEGAFQADQFSGGNFLASYHGIFKSAWHNPNTLFKI